MLRNLDKDYIKIVKKVKKFIHPKNFKTNNKRNFDMIDLDWLPKIEQNELIKKLKKKYHRRRIYLSFKTFFRL